MITNDGKQIIAKFLLGQAPNFASYIAAGCGPKPMVVGQSASVSSAKDSLDFEMFRVPILSKGLIKENGVEKLVLKAEMPNDQRYKITEVGVYPAANNSIAGQYDSKLLITFSTAEPWIYSDGTSSSAVPYPNIPIDQGNNSASINSSTEEFLFINSNSTIFDNQTRQNRQEPPRYLNRALMVSGSSSFIESGFDIVYGSKYIENSSVNIDLSQNLPDDEIKLAFSLISRLASTNTNPDEIKIVLEFVNNLSNSAISTPKAVARISVSDYEIQANRYRVVTKKLSQFVQDSTFSWANVNLLRIYCSVINSGTPTDDYYVLLDGLRIDNVTVENPLYSLVGYNVIATDDGLPTLKKENTNNYIEYRFGIGVS
jgi:hypothetical protein